VCCVKIFRQQEDEMQSAYCMISENNEVSDIGGVFREMSSHRFLPNYDGIDLDESVEIVELPNNDQQSVDFDKLTLSMNDRIGYPGNFLSETVEDVDFLHSRCDDVKRQAGSSADEIVLIFTSAEWERAKPVL